MSDTVDSAGIEGLGFDEAFAELGRVVGVLETGGGSLEATISEYERAVALQRRCEQLLATAELRVQQLMARTDAPLAAVDVGPGEAGDAG